MGRTFEEFRVVSQPVAWSLLILLSLSIVVWGMFVYTSIPNTPRNHDYAPIPDAPGQSIYSTDTTPRGTDVPQQYQPLPEAKSRPSGSGGNP